MAAQAQDGQSRNRGERAAQYRSERSGQAAGRVAPQGAERTQRQERFQDRADRVQRAQRAAQIDRGSEQRAARVERQGDRAARQSARQGDYGRAAQIDRQSEQAARQVERRGDQRAAQVAQGRQWNSRNGDSRNWNDNRARDVRNTGASWRNNERRYSEARRDNRQARGWDNRWRDNSRYDWQRYRAANRQLYSVGRYYSPYRNYSYRRLGIGFRLDSLFFGSRYWINDPWSYRLPDVNGPYRWVRYYDDVLLVDIYSGEVVDVIHDFFW